MVNLVVEVRVGATTGGVDELVDQYQGPKGKGRVDGTTDSGGDHRGAPASRRALNVGPVVDAVWWYGVVGTVAAKDQDRGAVE
ncbi:MAG: hypothetical protein CM1200mP26_26370 [Acidimicrobiales bacterium]|nr:MAG: hypothetical protein CM1200mP26_26370 [Acidimicrobiales bacterium]